MMFLGIDIGGTSVKAALLRRDVIRTGISAEYARPDRDTLTRAIRSAVAEACDGAPPDGLGRVGLCVPGRLSEDGGSIDLAVNVPGLVGYRFEDLVETATGARAPFCKLGDAEAATLDVARDMPAGRTLGIAIGTGVGMALVEDGRPIRLGRGGIGHLGQIDVGPIGDGISPGDRIGPDGGRNSLEAYLGLPALRARFGQGLSGALGSMDDTDPALVALSRALRIALALYEPQHVLLLGGVGMAMRCHAALIDRMVREGITGVVPAGWQLAFGRSRHHAAIGAAHAARGSHTERKSLHSQVGEGA
ncbi:MAG: ROK family protein [Planctomycetota bacterium]